MFFLISSLHHLTNFDQLFKKIRRFLKPGGLLVINEYVRPNRFQWTSSQLVIGNELPATIPSGYRLLQGSSFYKSHIYRPGILRMILTDPSEAAQSERIVPALHRYFKTEEEKALGGNLPVPVLKGIAHNFRADDEEAGNILTDASGKKRNF